jgi:alkanesulfonate monooxygenase SsuD/methylene tetrahydromethanopterin reductase-like flavin-dependent oxidoreductase (luciferase family)
VSRPFRFGVNVRTAGSAGEWAEKARKVEGLGYSVLLVPDHLVDLLAPFPALATAAAATTWLRVGTGVIHGGQQPDATRPAMDIHRFALRAQAPLWDRCLRVASAGDGR